MWTLNDVAHRSAGDQGIILYRNHELLGHAFNRVEWHTQAEGTTRPALVFHPLLDLDREPLDLLVQRGKRNAELLCRVRLVPLAALQFVNDDAPLNIFQNVE